MSIIMSQVRQTGHRIAMEMAAHAQDQLQDQPIFINHKALLNSLDKSLNKVAKVVDLHTKRDWQ